jgi:hypothetical protein
MYIYKIRLKGEEEEEKEGGWMREKKILGGYGWGSEKKMTQIGSIDHCIIRLKK